MGACKKQAANCQSCLQMSGKVLTNIITTLNFCLLSGVWKSQEFRQFALKVGISTFEMFWKKCKKKGEKHTAKSYERVKYFRKVTMY